MKKFQFLFYFLIASLSSASQIFDEVIDISKSYDKINSIDRADLDGDGLEDLLCSSSDGSKFFWYKNLGDDTYSEQIIIAQGFGIAVIVIAEDINSDGNVDVVTMTSNSNKLSWHENDGTGNFIFEHTITDQYNYDSYSYYNNSILDIVDLDNDSDPDIISLSRTDNLVVLHINNGVGEFDMLSLNSGIDSPVSFRTGDIDNDNILDIVVVSSGNSITNWFKGDGAGGFQEVEIIEDGFNSINVELLDIDLDGDLDVLINEDQSADGLILYLNNGGGSFQLHSTLIDGSGIRLIREVDLNADGDLDLLLYRKTSDGIDNEIFYLENLGNLTFSSQQLFSQYEYINTERYPAVVFEDYDLDGLEDLIVSTYRSGGIMYLKRTPSGFEPIKYLTSQIYSSYITPYDVNNDQINDLNGFSKQYRSEEWYIDSIVLMSFPK